MGYLAPAQSQARSLEDTGFYVWDSFWFKVCLSGLGHWFRASDLVQGIKVQDLGFRI